MGNEIRGFPLKTKKDIIVIPARSGIRAAGPRQKKQNCGCLFS